MKSRKAGDVRSIRLKKYRSRSAGRSETGSQLCRRQGKSFVCQRVVTNTDINPAQLKCIVDVRLKLCLCVDFGL